jgi:hypothetical protein
LVADDSHVAGRDRVAHQYQIWGGKVWLSIAYDLSTNLTGVGLFQPGADHIGPARISTGLGCPAPRDGSGLSRFALAFLTPSAARVDFIGINDPDTHVQFMKLLAATADGAGAGVVARSIYLMRGLLDFLGLVTSSRIVTHILYQTVRTTLSAKAYQTYWTGIVQTGGVLGKFKFLPVPDQTPPGSWSAGRFHLTEEWRKRQVRGSVAFDLYWLPFIDERVTSLLALTRPWQEHQHLVGGVTFPQCDPDGGEPRWGRVRATGSASARTRCASQRQTSALRARLSTAKARLGATLSPRLNMQRCS